MFMGKCLIVLNVYMDLLKKKKKLLRSCRLFPCEVVEVKFNEENESQWSHDNYI